MKMFRVGKGKRHSIWIKGNASIAWVKTWGLGGHNLFESYKEINITDTVQLRKIEWYR